MKSNFPHLLLFTFILFAPVQLSKVKLSRPINTPNKNHPITDYFYDPISLGTLNSPYLIDVQFDNNEFGVMALSLFENQTFVTDCGSDFEFFDCDVYLGCQTNPNTKFYASLPFVNVSGMTLSSSFLIGNFDNNFFDWGGTFMPAGYATNCSGEFDSKQLYGVIGMGAGGLAAQNFMTSTSFSIYLAPDGLAGELGFGQNNDVSDYDLVASITENVTLNWEVSIESIFTDTNYTLKGWKVLFDATTNFITLPVKTFNQTLMLLSNYSVNCTIAPKTPLCLYNDSIDLLPTFNITTSSGSIIPIPPSTYLKNMGPGSYNLMFAAIDNVTSDKFSVPITHKYANSIILGIPFLQNRFVAFDFTNATSPTITIYNANISFFNDITNIIFFVTVGVLAVTSIIVLICACRKYDPIIRIKRKGESKNAKKYSKSVFAGSLKSKLGLDQSRVSDNSFVFEGSMGNSTIHLLDKEILEIDESLEDEQENMEANETFS